MALTARPLPVDDSRSAGLVAVARLKLFPGEATRWRSVSLLWAPDVGNAKCGSDAMLRLLRCGANNELPVADVSSAAPPAASLPAARWCVGTSALAVRLMRRRPGDAP